MIRKYNPAGYLTASMEALNGNFDWKHLHGELEKKIYVLRESSREDMVPIFVSEFIGKGVPDQSCRLDTLSCACAEVPYDYDVEPSANVNSDYINAESATSVDGINAGLSNKGTS